ncbi:MAG: helix-turn-helix domain-containing protein [Chloroflexi bacterium]|nr:MAG: helix-turn-helix domain-containing protein [Chloroflexota bacterium]
MTHLETMSAAIDFIETHLQDEMTLADVADAVSYSLYHFSRVFSATVHHTPYDYLMRRRLSESSRDLLESDKKVVDIAFDYQFNNAETYSRAFKRLFHILPSQWRKQSQPEHWRQMPQLTLPHLEYRNPKSKISPTQIKTEKLHLVGLMSQLDCLQTDSIAALWNHLHATNVSGSEAFGLFLFPSGPGDANPFYMASICIREPSINHALLVEKQLPAQRYASFHHNGLPETRYLTFDYIFHTWLPQSGQKLSGDYVIEAFGNVMPLSGETIIDWDVWVPLGD